MPRKMTLIEMAAFDIACDAAINPTSPNVQISRALIEKLRAELSAAGWDWQKYAKIDKRQKKERAERWAQERIRARNGAEK